MKRDLSFRIHPLLAAVIAVGCVYALLLGAYGLTRWASQGEVMGRVQIAGVDLGGKTQEEAVSALLLLEDEYLARSATFIVDGNRVSLDPREAGLGFHDDSMAEAAMRVGREGNAANQFLWWLRHIFATVTLPLEGSTDPDALEDLFEKWDTEVIREPPRLGGLVVEDGVVLPVYPQPGTGLSRVAAARIVESALLAPEPQVEVLPTETIVSELTNADVDEALLEANQLLGAPIELALDNERVVFTVDQLVEAFRSETVTESRPAIVNSFDPEVIDELLQPVRSQFEVEAVNAEFVISGDDISIRPGSRGTRIDEVETAARLLRAGLSPGRLGQLPLVEDADPDVTTEYLESLGIRHLVSSFTTHHACCQDRVVNIQLMADTIDGHIVLPGETFSINGFVGERTEEKGYLPAGTLIGGELVDTVGGGVSQFATTMYNAVFWGGYEDIEHRPHTLYFSRYPEGIEATVNWRTPDLKFRNNTTGAILIDTRHTGTSVTVRIFGDNDGRIVKGEQTGGRTVINVVAGGGPEARHVEGTVSDRFAHTEPPSPLYEANPDLEVDQQIQRQGEREGWSVTVTRRILRGGTELVEEREWVVRYLPQRAIYQVHPCMVPGTSVECPPPPTTTTTAPPTTTTTTAEPPDTTEPPNGGG